AVMGLKQTTTGETLCDEKNPVILESMDFPAPAGRQGVGAGVGGARGQVGAGSGPRAALPGRDDAAARQGGGLQGGPQGGQSGRHGQAGPSGRPQQPQQQQPQDPQRQGAGAFGGPGAGRGTRDNAIPTRSDVWQNGPAEQGGRPGKQPLPPSGGPRAELPGGAPQQPQQQAVPPQQPQQSQQPSQPQRPQRPQATSWGADVPRGHEEPEATGQYTRPSADRQGLQDPASTAQFARPDYNAGRPQNEALPPATNAGDGRTPLYDTLETNWFHQNGQSQQPQQQAQPQRGGAGEYPVHDQTVPTPAVPQQPAQPSRPAQQRPASSPPPRRDGQSTGQSAGQGTDPASTTGSWRTSPNDELVRQAERVRKPAAGGVTTSGLPRRVPRANLVPGTAQESTHQSGPQVSRAPDDVRGRLTNLRRGIQQGRQAGSSTTGSFQLGPTHQQER
ncbi:hypothetical protein ABT360_17885, partial [Streptomyces sp. NPDC000229]